VSFCDQVILVATAEEQEDDSYIPNPILERVLRSAAGSKPEVAAIRQEIMSLRELESRKEEDKKNNVLNKTGMSTSLSREEREFILANGSHLGVGKNGINGINGTNGMNAPPVRQSPVPIQNQTSPEVKHSVYQCPPQNGYYPNTNGYHQLAPAYQHPPSPYQQVVEMQQREYQQRLNGDCQRPSADYQQRPNMEYQQRLNQENQQRTNMEHQGRAEYQQKNPEYLQKINGEFQNPKPNGDYQPNRDFPAKPNDFQQKVNGEYQSKPVDYVVKSADYQPKSIYQAVPKVALKKSVSFEDEEMKKRICNLCRKKNVSSQSSYCGDCEYYMSRFKPKN